MRSGQKRLVCRRCKEAPQAILIAGRPQRIVCSRCGIEAGFDEAQKLAIEHARKDISRDVIKGFQDRLVRSSRRSKHFEYRPGRIPCPSAPDFVFQ